MCYVLRTSNSFVVHVQYKILLKHSGIVLTSKVFFVILLFFILRISRKSFCPNTFSDVLLNFYLSVVS